MQTTKLKTFFSFIILSFFCFVVFSNFVFAAGTESATPAPRQNVKSLMQESGKISKYVNDANGHVELPVIIGTVVKIFITILGIVFIALMIYGGFLWMTARGNEEATEKSKELITNAVIGLVIVVAAYAITYFVMYSLTKGNMVSPNF